MEREASLNPPGNSLGVEDRQPPIPISTLPAPVEDPSKNKAVEFTTKSISYPFRGIVLKPQTHNKEENGFIDMGAFMVTFSVAYIMVLLAIGSVLYINPSWRRAWFHFIGESINNCYYFLVDNLPVPARFRRFQPCV
ncbi:hypothetical protein OIU78_024148 [Salix suchowensis]|nr:hypothetical protein OIU78_024148 [Salix suchowensis]